MRCSNLCASIGFVVLTASLDSAVTAQDVAQVKPAAAKESQAVGLTDIVVTARRREENLQNVPITVQALSGEEIGKHMVSDAFDLTRTFPALTVANSQVLGRQATFFTIRGQRQSGDDAPAGVAIYLAEVPVFSAFISRSFYDLANIQVLEGPQGTLFGRNSNGGAVLFSPHLPTWQFEGYAKVRYGNLNERYAEGMVNVPLVEDKLAVRLAGNIGRRDGFTKNTLGPDLDNQRYETWRASALFTPTEWLSNALVVQGVHFNERGPGFLVTALVPCASGGTYDCLFEKTGLLSLPIYQTRSPSDPRTSVPNLSLGGDAGDLFAQQQAWGPRKVAQENILGSHIRGEALSNITNIQISDALKLKNILGYSDLRSRTGQSNTGNIITGVTQLNSSHRVQKSDELQMSATFGESNAVIGLYIEDDTSKPVGHDNFRNLGDVLYPFLLQTIQNYSTKSLSKGIYAQASLDASRLVDGLRVTAGVRYTKDSNRITFEQTQTPYPNNILGLPPVATCSSVPGAAPNTPACSFRAEAGPSGVNYVVSAEYKPQHDILLYLTTRRGYKSGGFNNVSEPSLRSYGNEKVTDLEGGAKTQFDVGGAQIRLNLSAFHDWYRDIQVANVVTVGTSTFTLTQNGPTARIWGSTAQITMAPAARLQFGLTYNYLQGKYGRFIATNSSGQQVDLTGTAYVGTPKHSVLLSADYDVPLAGDTGEFGLHADMNYRSNTFLTIEGDPSSFQPSVTLFNARVDWRKIMGTQIELGLFIRNIANKTYKVGFNPLSSLGWSASYYAEPRTFGAELIFTF